MKLSVTLLASLLFLFAGSCSCGSDDGAVPRPEGFARIATYPASYSMLDSVGVCFLVNDSVTVVSRRNDVNGGKWVTLGYPRYGALLYLTFTPSSPDIVGGIIDNRVERMALNAGNASSEIAEFTGDGGFTTKLMFTRSATVTPVQFISVAPDSSMVISGALFIDGADVASSPDSIAPVVDAVGNDIIHSLRHAAKP